MMSGWRLAAAAPSPVAHHDALSIDDDQPFCTTREWANAVWTSKFVIIAVVATASVGALTFWFLRRQRQQQQQQPRNDDARPAERHRSGGRDAVTRSTTGLIDLPLSSLVEISHHLSILDSRKLVMTCKSLWTNRHRLESGRRTVVVQNAAERQVLQGLLLQRPFLKLETLDLGEWATDEFLAALDWRQNVPLLRELSLEGSTAESGAALVRALRVHPSVRYVNVTLCPLVEYLDALRLRDCLGQPYAIVRRLPQELCGMVEVNDADLNVNLSIQRFYYWPDGTFQVVKSDGQEVLGFFTPVRRSGAGVLTLKLQAPMHDDSPGTSQAFPLAGSRQVSFMFGCTDEFQPRANWITLIEPASMPLNHAFYFDANGDRQEAENEESDFWIQREEVLELDDPRTPDKTIATIWKEVNQRIVRQ